MQLSEVESLAQDVANLGRLEVAVVIQLLEDMLDTSSGNITVSQYWCVDFGIVNEIRIWFVQCKAIIYA